MSNCKICLAVVKKNQLKIACDDCKGIFHAKCADMSQADLDNISEQKSLWRCGPCGKERRKSMLLETSATDGNLTLQDVMEALNEIKANQRKTVEDFNQSYEILHTKIEEHTATLNSGMAKIEDYIKRLEDVQNENVALHKKMSILEARVEELEQYSRRNCMEIQGIPEEENESVIEVVKRVGKALNVDITDSSIDICHRVGKKGGERPRGIIVKFVRRMDKEVLMKNRRTKKRDFSTRHLNMHMDKPVYLNDSLSPAKRKLLGQARQLKKENGYKYLWLREGTILLRKEEGSPVLEVKNQSDLSKL